MHKRDFCGEHVGEKSRKREEDGDTKESPQATGASEPCEEGQERRAAAFSHLQQRRCRRVLTDPGRCVRAHLAPQRSPLDGGREQA